MTDTRFGKILQFVLGTGLIVGAVIFFRAQSGNLGDLKATVPVESAMRAYQRRMDATRSLLETGQMDGIYGRRLKMQTQMRRAHPKTASSSRADNI